jgi:hypothetical protein
MKTVFWSLLILTVILTYTFWFAIPQQQASLVVTQMQLEAQVQGRQEDMETANKALQRTIPKSSVEKPVEPKKVEEMPAPTSAKKVGEWLTELSKGIPLVTVGLTIWAKLEDKKKKKK